MNVETLEITRQVICGTRIKVLGRILMGVGQGRVSCTRVVTSILRVVAVATIHRLVSPDAAELALWTVASATIAAIAAPVAAIAATVSFIATIAAVAVGTALSLMTIRMISSVPSLGVVLLRARVTMIPIGRLLLAIRCRT
jgi:hypothetical protein